jgi:hypothetical protein
MGSVAPPEKAEEAESAELGYFFQAAGAIKFSDAENKAPGFAEAVACADRYGVVAYSDMTCESSLVPAAAAAGQASVAEAAAVLQALLVCNAPTGWDQFNRSALRCSRPTAHRRLPVLHQRSSKLTVLCTLSLLQLSMWPSPISC